jgi:hypothetical protein
MNSSQLINNDEALRLFFNDEIYYVGVPDAPTRLELPKTEPQKSQLDEPPAAQLPSIPTPQVDLAEKNKISFNYKGNNQRNILILVNDAQNPVSTSEGRLLLNNLMKSVNITIDDAALLNWSAYPHADFTALKAFFNCKIVLSFGVSPAELKLADFESHQLSEKDGVKFIFTHLAHVLVSDVGAKRILWESLQSLFLA